MNKVKTMDEALDMIQDGAVVTATGFVLHGMADEVFKAVEDRFLETGHPKNLECFFLGSAGLEGYGFDRWAHEGLVAKVSAGHVGLTPKLCELINDNKCKAYNWPHGAVLNGVRAALQGKKGFLSKIGLRTFADPRLEGGRMNAAADEDVAKVVEFDGEEWMYYTTPHLDVALIRGTTADVYGNISIEEECVPLNMLETAMAVRSCGGKVIIQVKNLSSTKLPAADIFIPAPFVDAVVVSAEPEKYHRQTKNIYTSAVYSGHVNIPVAEMKPLPLDVRKVIARRCFMELKKDTIVNLGIGIPELVSGVAAEEGVADAMTMSCENGTIGGIPGAKDTFGAAANAMGMLPINVNFDLYNGGNLSMAVQGLGECDAMGNINVSKFGKKLPGCGGFVDITQSTPLIIFAGSFTAGGAKLEVGGGKLTISQEGKVKKFKSAVQQITYSGEYGASKGQKVLYVTERAVFRLTEKGLMLSEIAPGVDLEKDILAQMEFRPLIAEDLRTMDARIFTEGKMGFSFDEQK